MYQLDVILIGCHEDVVPHLRRELTSNVARIEASTAMSAKRWRCCVPPKTKKRLLILHLKPFEGLEELRRLCHVLAQLAGHGLDGSRR